MRTVAPLLLIAVLVACDGGRSLPGTAGRALSAEADPATASLPHPDDACAEQADPTRWSEAGEPDVGANPPFVSAHRGASLLAPENTLWAYRHAFAYGADTVEIDLRESLDGVIYSLHDSTVDRTTDGSGELALMTSLQIDALNAADFEPWRETAYNPTPIPRLEEILELAAAVGGGVEMDIKFIRNYLSLVLLLDEYGLVEDSYYAANGAGAELIRLIQPRARFIYNVGDGETPEDLYNQAQQSSLFGSRLAKFSAEHIAAVHDRCMLVLPHTYDEGDEHEGAQWDLGRARGIDGAQVNQPDVIRARQAAADPRRKLPTVLVPGDSERAVCLRNAFNQLGLPHLTLFPPSGAEVQTGIDGCVTLAMDVDQEAPAFAGSPALFPAQWSPDAP